MMLDAQDLMKSFALTEKENTYLNNKDKKFTKSQY